MRRRRRCEGNWGCGAGAPGRLFSLLFLYCCAGVGWAGPCWETLLRCQEEPACASAYGQYQAACEPVLEPGGLPPAACPSHCIGALVRLNETREGAALESCACGADARCRRLKAAIEPCLPRPAAPGLGCMDARRRCEQEPACGATLAAYLSRCGQLFNGRRCTAACRATIRLLLATPPGPRLERCVCDGVERPFCEVLKGNMGRLCFPGSEGAEDEDYQEEEEEETGPEETPDPEGAGGDSAQVRSEAPPLRFCLAPLLHLFLLLCGLAGF
ncbi:growth arrest-specific protein 1-like [Rhinatrema bivittatum]|uniref:growth arrest-specific protein 1-like n=1 Tax=Rhinatrema bivittatum TaxID=194408 RepID=UPI00112A07CA|nr:growth arrest-specific protein 1-like [Rhinatrema bivittatum]